MRVHVACLQEPRTSDGSFNYDAGYNNILIGNNIKNFGSNVVIIKNNHRIYLSVLESTSRKRFIASFPPRERQFGRRSQARPQHLKDQIQAVRRKAFRCRRKWLIEGTSDKSDSFASARSTHLSNLVGLHWSGLCFFRCLCFFPL
jgi:hypothetical protein